MSQGFAKIISYSQVGGFPMDDGKNMREIEVELETPIQGQSTAIVYAPSGNDAFLDSLKQGVTVEVLNKNNKHRGSFIQLKKFTNAQANATSVSTGQNSGGGSGVRGSNSVPLEAILGGNGGVLVAASILASRLFNGQDGKDGIDEITELFHQLVGGLS